MEDMDGQLINHPRPKQIDQVIKLIMFNFNNYQVFFTYSLSAFVIHMKINREEIRKERLVSYCLVISNVK